MHIQDQDNVLASAAPAAYQVSSMGQTLAELRHAEELMSRHVGPTHIIRSEIGKMIDRFEHLLGI